MAELPFQQPQTLNERQNRALALAAVFQSAQLKVLGKAVTSI